MRESEKPGVFRLPLIEQRHDRLHQTLAYAAIPKIRPNGQRTKEPDAAPVSRKVRTDKFSVRFSSKRRLRIGAPSGADVAGIAHESHRVRQTDEGAEREPHDGVGSGELSFLQRMYDDFRFRCVL